MANTRKLEIRCTACGRTTLARPEPLYDGFRRTGEAMVCTACGHRYASREQTPFVDGDSRPAVFGAADRAATVRVFRDDERRHSCAWCRHLVLNPFGQRCGLTNREVEATDLCDRFEHKPEEPEAAADAPTAPPDPLDRLFRK